MEATPNDAPHFEAMQRKHIEILLVITALIAVIIALFASSDQAIITADDASKFVIYHFPAYNDVILNLTSGYVVSVLFYFVIIFLPEYLRRCRFRSNALKLYDNFRVDVMGLILHASGKDCSYEEIRELTKPEKFKEYFSEDETGSRVRWYAVLNELNDYVIAQIASELEILKGEIQFIINNIDIDNEELFAYLKRLSNVIYTMSKRTSDYEDIKIWGRFLWSLYSNFDTVEGYSKEDRILAMLNKI